LLKKKKWHSYNKIIILKPTPEMSEQAHRPGNGSSILNRQSSKQSD